jgi:reactive intermediate/imine deaminase
MERQVIQPQGLAVPKAPYSPVVVSGDLVYTAGQVGMDESGAPVSDDVAEQTHQTLRNLGKCLEAAGCTYADVIKVNAYLADLADVGVYNEIYQEYFRPPFPARSTVQAGLIGFKVEIEAVARKP